MKSYEIRPRPLGAPDPFQQPRWPRPGAPGRARDSALRQLRVGQGSQWRAVAGGRGPLDPLDGDGMFFFWGGEIKIIMAKHGKTLIYDDLVRFMVIL